MKDFNLQLNGTALVFSVDEDWVENIKIKVLEPIEPQVYAAAMSDPKKSGITTDNDAVNASIEEVKELVEKAAKVNEEKYGDIKVYMTVPGKYEVKFFDGQTYDTNLSIKEAAHAIDVIEEYLSHYNIIRVRTLAGKGRTELQKCMELEKFIAQKVHKVISVYARGEDTVLVYIPKGWRNTPDENEEYEF